MSDDRPSIAELKRLDRELEDARGVHLEARQAELLEATPILLEIAAAALAWEQARTALHDASGSLDQSVEAARYREFTVCRDAYRAALAKVRR